MLRLVFFNLLGAAGLWAASSVSAQTELEVHLDADYSIASDAAHAIEKGLRSALSQSGYKAAGATIKIVRRDHRTNVKRSKAHMEQFVQSPNAIAMVGGMHSPPYLTHRDYINEKGVPLLLPWSAAGPITRGAFEGRNWVFRLSVDDTKAGGFLVSRAVDHSGCENLALVLIDTGWGRANFKTLSTALVLRGKVPATTVFFDASAGRATAKTLAENLRRYDVVCAVLLADWDNGAQIATAISELPEAPRVFSHWGIMGGPFGDMVSVAARERLTLEVLQTCGLAREQEGSAELRRALAHVEGSVQSLSQIDASAGFVHGHDLGLVLVAALNQAAVSETWNGTVEDKREALRMALENLKVEVPGILRQYTRPFAPFDASNPDAHEALGQSDLCMARFAPEGHLIAAQ